MDAKNKDPSGAAARRWRKQVAAFSRRSDDYVRTLKYPLDLSLSGQLDFGSIARLYEVTEGVGKGSLAGLLFATHLSGARLFPREPDTKVFRNQKGLAEAEAAFHAGWGAFFGVSNAELTPGRLIGLLGTRPRSAQGVEPTYGTRPIAAELYKLVRGTRPDEDRNLLVNMRDTLDAFERELQAQFPSRADVSKNVPLALRIFDAVMASAGVSLPALQASEGTMEALTPKGSTMDFDWSLPSRNLADLDDTAIHSVVAQKLSEIHETQEGWTGAGHTRKRVQKSISTENSNALSWLFGLGWVYWRTTSVTDICTDYGSDLANTALLERITALKEWFDAIPADPVFAGKHYAPFRSSVGGKIDSWVANYLNRLGDLQTALSGAMDGFSLPSTLLDANNADLVTNAGVEVREVAETLRTLPALAAKVSPSLDALLGRNAALPGKVEVEAIEAFSDFMDGLSGLLQMVRNRLEQESESRDADRAARAKACQFTLPTWLKRLPKINRISGGLPKVEEELQAAEIKLNLLRARYQDHIVTVKQWAVDSNQSMDALAQFAEQEQRLLDARGGAAAEPATRMAKRKILQRVARLASTGSDQLKNGVRDLLAPLGIAAKDLNRLIFNALGALYRSPYSNSRHQAYAMDSAALEALDVVAFVERAVDCARSAFTLTPDLQHYRDLLRLESLATMVTLAGLPARVPTALVEREKLEALCRLPVFVRPLLETDSVARETLIKCINLYVSEMSGIIAMLFRESFVLKTKFVRVGENSLHYVPKDTVWSPPAHYYGSSAPIATVLDRLAEETGNQKVLPRTVVPKLLKADLFASQRGGSPFTAFLSQSPHDWFIDLGMPGVPAAAEVSSLRIDKDGVMRRMVPVRTPARLVGASSYKQVLDDWLVKSAIKFGEYNLMFLQSYRQSVTVAPDGGVSVRCEPAKVFAEVALTVTEPGLPATTAHPLAKSVIGIDLGEIGIGYSVFRAEDIAAHGAGAQPVESGAIPIRSVRNLIRTVAHYRRRVQPNQRFRSRESTALESLRDNVVGDLAHAIDGLCARHRGFPVLESSLRGLAAGSAQLKLIYDRVLNLYTYSSTDAHKTIRKHHWAGADTWEHPSLQREELKERKGKLLGTGQWIPLRLHPGADVHPAGTSQTCSHCGRNPIAMIYDDKRGGQYTVEENGLVQLGSGEWVALKRRDNPSASSAEREIEARALRHQKRHAPYQYPEEQRRLTKDSLLTLVRRQLRQPQDSTRAKDTTQSRYACVFSDCGQVMHADENAAVNIVRKWVKDREVR